MKFKAMNSRCMITRKGKLIQQFKLKVQGEEILSIIGHPIKCLRDWFDAPKDTNNSSVQKQAEEFSSTVPVKSFY